MTKRALHVSGRFPFSSSADFRGRRVTVLGLGTKGGGVEVAKYFLRQRARVTVTDLRTTKELQTSLDELQGQPVNVVLGLHRDEDMLEADLVVPNPAVPRTSPYLARARAAGVPIVTDIAVFFAFCKAPIAGITGTRGKTTTTTVAGEILRRERPDTVVAGNILRSPLADLERITATTPVVLELSSAQLEGLEPYRMSPHWALYTTLLQDHLNRYDTFAAYAKAKETIFTHQRRGDVFILPTDDPLVTPYAARARGRVAWCGPWESAEESFLSQRSRSSAALSGVYLRDGDVIWRRDGRHEEILLPWASLGGRGVHTRRNLLAGATLALEMGASAAATREVLKEFRGVPHRLEIVRVLQGRTFVNDTTATTPEAVIAALETFPDHRLVLITGGTDKNLSYESLVGHLSDRVVHLVLLDGSATRKIVRLLAGTRYARAPVVQTMADAVREASARSLPGDVVLLSPGAASFELFRDEFDRGEQFRVAVAALLDSSLHGATSA